MADIICPWCGEGSLVEDARFIASSAMTTADPVLGPPSIMRFKPLRFDAGCHPLDPTGNRATVPACATCRIAWPADMWLTARRGTLAISASDPQRCAEWLLEGATHRMSALKASLIDASPTEPPQPALQPSVFRLRDAGSEIALLCLVEHQMTTHPTAILLDEHAAIPERTDVPIIRLTRDDTSFPNIILRSGNVAIDKWPRDAQQAYLASMNNEAAAAIVLLALGLSHGDSQHA
ncbi:MAG: hypothetical protein MK100_05825 [Phycisphaerales bacterium]|nr:hypothetical protein [Phycisphaerales bacterium]